MSTPVSSSFADGYPVVLRMGGRRVLVVGGGRVAAGKVASLLAAGAAVTVVAPEVSEAMPGGVTIVSRRYRRRDLRGHQLVVAATGDSDVNQRIYDDAGDRGLWICSVDDPDRCSFTLPALHRDGPVLISVSTSGASPALAQALRDRCVAAVPGDLAAVAAELASARAVVRAEHGTSEGHPWRPIVDELLDAAAGRTQGGASVTAAT